MWVVASPPWRRGPQVRAPWHHGGHGAVDAVRPMVPPGRASGRGVAGVYTDRLKRPLGAVLVHSCTLLRRCNTARPAGDSAGATKKGRACGLAEGRLLVRRLTKRRSLRLPCRTECAFPLHHRPGGVGRNPPRQPAGHYGEWPNWANALEQPPARLRGGCAGARRPRPGARLYGKAQSGQRASLRAHPGPGRDTIRLPVVG